MLSLFFLVSGSVHAAIEDCRDPTPDERFQLDLCAAHAGCRLVVAMQDTCAGITNTVKRFFADEKPVLDPGEYRSDRDAPLGPSEIEQARKDNERYQQSQARREAESRRTFNELVVADRLIKERLGKYCANPLSGNCEDATRDADSLKSKVEAFNSNADFVSLRGKIAAESPGIAAPYGKLQSAAWNERNRKQEEARKNARETEEKKKESAPENQAKPDAIAPENISADAVTAALPRRGGGSSSVLFQNAITQSEQEERDRPAREAREKAERERLAEQQRLASAQRNAVVSSSTPVSAQDRLLASYDQRISAARQQCAASEGSCNTACIGIGALGLFSALSGNRAAASATQDQLQQCSNRCDQAKSSCDQQVASLEDEKQQAIGGGNSASQQAGVALPPGGTCAPSVNSLRNYISAQHEYSRATGGTMKPISDEGAVKRFNEIHNMHFRNSSLGSLKEKFAQFKSEVSGGSSVGVVQKLTRSESGVMLQMVECEIGVRERQLVASAPSNGGSVTCASTPQESFRRFDSEMSTFGSRYPNQQSRGGARDQYQYSLFYGSNGLQTLEKYRNCLSAADYQANKRALEGMRDKGRQGCEQLSSSSGTCTPTYPSNWRG